MNRRRLSGIVVLAVGLAAAFADSSYAFHDDYSGEWFPWRRQYRVYVDPTAWRGPDLYARPDLAGVPVPQYGKAPGVVPNPYPWTCPAMYSGFRHYHIVPPPPHAEEAPLVLPESAPMPKEKKGL